MDVKTGSGAFMPTLKAATSLSHSIVDVCRAMKTKIVVLITDMEQPLGRAIGNALEIRECIEFLNGRTPEDLETVTIALAAHMIRLGGQARSLDHASKLAYEAVSKGEAAKRFRHIIRAQGGDERVMDNPDLLPRAAQPPSGNAKLQEMGRLGLSEKDDPGKPPCQSGQGENKRPARIACRH